MSRSTSAASHGRGIGLLVVGLSLVLLVVAVAFYRDALGLGAMEGSPIWLATAVVAGLGLLFGGWLTSRGLSEGRILRTGTAGRATIVAVQETGMGVGGSNNQGGGTPYAPIVRVDLRVTLPGQPSYDASVREVARGLRLLQLRPGLAVNVRALAQKPTKVVIDWDAQNT